MSLSLELGTSSGDLNTGGNLSESSFLEALFGLKFGPTDFTEFHRFLPYAGWDFADFADDADFLQLIYHPSRFTGRNLVSY